MAEDFKLAAAEAHDRVVPKQAFRMSIEGHEVAARTDRLKSIVETGDGELAARKPRPFRRIS